MWMGLGMLGYVFVLYTWVFPVSQYMRLSERVAATIPHDLPPGAAVMIDYKEPSLAFYQGGAIREADDTYFARTPSAAWTPWVVITQQAWSQVPAAAKQSYEEVSRTKGWNYADGGRIVEVLVLRKR
jgi:hypothetical protein